MNFMLNIDLKKASKQINYKDNILLTGSCFTEHIGNALSDLKFSILQNPNGILFDPGSVSRSLVSYIGNKKYKDTDLFQLNETWHSWEHHSRFSHVDKKIALTTINNSQEKAHQFLKQADWIIITLGSAFQYQLTKDNTSNSGILTKGNNMLPVANCHRAPAQWFKKHLLEIEEIISQLESLIQELKRFNHAVNIIFTVSPVRHTRDGVVENNRSKARLIESVHHVVNKFEQLHYFPAYELVIDVLRDYRFYDSDLVHPNYMGTEFVLEKFSEVFIDDQTRELMQEVKSIVIARKHKAFQPATNAHNQFLQSYFEKTKTLMGKFSFLDLSEELNYFGGKQIL